MNKSIILTPTQTKAKEAGATMFLFYIKDQKYAELALKRKGIFLEEFIKFYSPIQKGDKDIFIIPKKCSCNVGMSNKTGKCISCGTFIDYPMTSYNYSFSECIDVKVVRLREITPDEFIKARIISQYEFEEYGFELVKTRINQQLKEQNIKRIIDNNDYVLLAELI